MSINFTVNYDLLASQTDSADTGIDSDLVALIGTVVFTPLFADNRAVLAPTRSPRPAGLKLQPVSGYLDTDGRLKASPGGVVGVRLPARDPIMDLDTLFYRADFNVRTAAGEPVKVDPGFFEAPIADTTVELAEAMLSTSPGQLPTGITKIAPGSVRLDDDGLVVFGFGGVDIPHPLDLTVTGSTALSELSDITATGLAVGTAGSAAEARLAIDAASTALVSQQVADEDIPGQVAAAVAADETVAAAAAVAAEAAVDADIAGRDLLEKGDPGVPYVGDIEGDWITAGIGPLGEFLFGINTDGTAEFNAVSVGDDAVTTTVDAADVLWAPVVFDDDTYSEIHVDNDGRVQQWALDAWASRMGFGNPDTVHILIGLGQSNMSGRGLPISAEIDPPNPRIYQYGANGSSITQATVPLDMVDTAYGVSPLTLIAREYLQRIPENDVVLLIPAARGGSILGDATTVSSSGVWNVAYTGASADLYGLAKTQITAAIAAAGQGWPTATRQFVGMFWHQGESNTTVTSESDYATRLDAIVADLRTHVADSDMPVVLGGMVPEWVAVTSGAENIVAAHVDTPKRVVATGYAIPPANSGGNLNLDPIDLLHFHRAGVEELSRRMLTAWDRALRNTTDSVPHPPASVSATVNGTTLTVDWAQPMCRYTGFTVQYSLNGGPWTAITHTTVNTTATATIAGTLPVQVRVSTTNNVGTSPTSTPVYAVVIKEP